MAFRPLHFKSAIVHRLCNADAATIAQYQAISPQSIRAPRHEYATMWLPDDREADPHHARDRSPAQARTDRLGRRREGLRHPLPQVGQDIRPQDQGAWPSGLVRIGDAGAWMPQGARKEAQRRLREPSQGVAPEKLRTSVKGEPTIADLYGSGTARVPGNRPEALIAQDRARRDRSGEDYVNALNCVTVDLEATIAKSQAFPMQNMVGPNKTVRDVSIGIIEWKSQVEDRKTHPGRENGIILGSQPANVTAPGFDFSAYAYAAYFQELADINLPRLDDLSDPDLIRFKRSSPDRIFAPYSGGYLRNLRPARENSTLRRCQRCASASPVGAVPNTRLRRAAWPDEMTQALPGQGRSSVLDTGPSQPASLAWLRRPTGCWDRSLVRSRPRSAPRSGRSRSRDLRVPSADGELGTVPTIRPGSGGDDEAACTLSRPLDPARLPEPGPANGRPQHRR